MRASTNVWSRFITAALLASAVVALPGRAAAQCVGDCGGDGAVSISDLVTGVNIALGSQPVSACQAFANQQNEVTIAQLIQGVNNALAGCPPPADTPTATATDRPPVTATGTVTAPPTATSTATQPSTPTATGIPTGTATATATGIPTGTATATDIPTSTATATATGMPTGTASATATGVPAGTASATLTPTPTATPSATEAVDPGDAAAGRAAIVSTGLGSVQTLVGAVVAIVTNDGPAPLVFGVDEPIGGPADVELCPDGGIASQSCEQNGSTITLALGADNCVTGGAMAGSAQFNGLITITAGGLCGPPPLFVNGTYVVDELGAIYRDAAMEQTLAVSAALTGSVMLTPSLPIGEGCLVSALSLTLSGILTSALPDGSGVEVMFNGTQVSMTNITFNADCVPVAYTLTFNGTATFTPMHAGLLEASAALNGDVHGESFPVTFANFVLVQNGTTAPATVTMSGNMSSSCFGGSIGLSTFAPLAVTAGQLCPAAGVLDVTGGGTTARVTYDNGGVTVAPAVGTPEAYPSCLDPALLMCPA